MNMIEKRLFIKLGMKHINFQIQFIRIGLKPKKSFKAVEIKNRKIKLLQIYYDWFFVI